MRFQSHIVFSPFAYTNSFFNSIFSGEVLNSSAATFFIRSTIASQARAVALPFRSAVALAADGEVLAMRHVLVVLIFTLEGSTEKISAATCNNLVLTP